MTDIAEWQGPVGQVWASEWERTDRTFGGLTRRLLERIAAVPGGRVLDVGCGAGEVSLAVARARPGAQVLGLDISAELLTAAGDRAGGLPNLRFELADAAVWRARDFVPDLLVSRHGVMFFADPVGASAHLREIALPGARMVFSCFAALADNPWAGDVVAAVAPERRGVLPDPHAPGPFAFADPEHTRSILETAGWADIAFELHRYRNIIGEGIEPVEDALAFFRRIGPAAPALRALPDGERAGAESRLRALLECHREGGQVAFDAAAWIVSAHAPGKSV